MSFFSSFFSEWLPAAVLIQAVLLVACAGFIIHRSRVIRGRCAKDGGVNGDSPKASVVGGSRSSPSAEQAETVGTRPDEETQQKAEPVGEESLRKIVLSIEEENLRDLLKSRLDDLADEEGDVAKALTMVGMSDEIRILNATANVSDARALQKLDTALRLMLAEMEAEVIDDDVWNPARQKATEVQHDLPAGSEPVLGEKVASGLSYQGRICRKQTVTLHRQALSI